MLASFVLSQLDTASSMRSGHEEHVTQKNRGKRDLSPVCHCTAWCRRNESHIAVHVVRSRLFRVQPNQEFRA